MTDERHPDGCLCCAACATATVGLALLGSWPTQVGQWGREGIAAYIAELGARGVTPDQALVAIRSYDPDADFPPSAAKVAQQARVDPSRPTFVEALALIYGPRGIVRATAPKRSGGYPDAVAMERATVEAMRDRAGELHPLVALFVQRYGLERLRFLPLDDPEFGDVKRRELERAWADHCVAYEGRQVAAIVRGGRGELGRLDPLSVLGGRPAQIGSGS